MLPSDKSGRVRGCVGKHTGELNKWLVTTSCNLRGCLARTVKARVITFSLEDISELEACRDRVGQSAHVIPEANR